MLRRIYPPEILRREAKVKLPRLSIAAKLYAIFVLLATVTVGWRRARSRPSPRTSATPLPASAARSISSANSTRLD
jgi:hypothetical protein